MYVLLYVHGVMVYCECALYVSLTVPCVIEVQNEEVNELDLQPAGAEGDEHAMCKNALPRQRDVCRLLL